jgi:hypothetical protein
VVAAAAFEDSLDGVWADRFLVGARLGHVVAELFEPVLEPDRSVTLVVTRQVACFR